ncbi:histidinol-phosphatase HisJ family protein [Candidatus Bathyarchaeota archaeon]|nr:histidinol-phosphatase HisJ family protein [Candidatus Bathyarchaeota archaeon]
MSVDYHVHTFFSGDARGRILEYVKIALIKKLEDVGISDHFIPGRMIGRLDEPPVYKKLSDYVKKINEAKRKIKSAIGLKVGVEVDFIPGLENEIKNVLKGLIFDYIIGSVHFIEEWPFDHPKYILEYQKWDPVKLYEKYFMVVQVCAKSKIFDVIGHPDLIKKFGYKPKTDITDLYVATAKVFKENDVCIEVNTSGLRHPCREIYPNKRFLKMCYEEGVQITLGSDAHTPESVGMDFDKALDLIKKVGYRHITIFNGRRKQLKEV